MCTPKNIKLVLMVMNGFKVFAAAMLVLNGIELVAKWEFQRAYSTDIESYGMGILVIGAISPFSTICAFLGSKRHNKFLLTVHAILDYTFFGSLTFLTSSINAYLTPDYDANDRAECLSMDGRYNLNYPEMCPDYYASDRYARMKLAWIGKFLSAMVDSAEYTDLKNIQIVAGCCGFGLPNTCLTDLNPYPSGVLFDTVPAEWLEGRTLCDAEVDDFVWYVAAGTGVFKCDHYIDPTIADPILGGCEYEMPIGECMNQDPSLSGFEFKGCANAFEDELDANVGAMTAIVTLCNLFFLISATFACCHCWKRKETDILPNYVLDIPWDPDDPKNYKAKSKIMDEFDEEDAAAEKKDEDDQDFDDE